MSDIKFAVVGLGHIGRRHATIINEYPGAQLVATADNFEGASSHELYPKGIPFFSSLEELLASNIEIDVVNIATPNGVHCDQAKMALKSGKHVVIEKPMGLSKQECEEVVFTALQESRQVFVVKQNRYSPPSVWLKEVVQEGVVGDVLMVQTNCFWNRDDRYYTKQTWKGSQALDGGSLYTQFSHFVDILYWVFGDIKNIQARMRDFTHAHSTDFEDSGFVQFDFVNGGVGSLNFSTSLWDKNMESSITVMGSKGTLKVGGQYMNEVEYCHIDDYEMPKLAETNPPNDYGPFKGSAANHHYVIENVVNTLTGKGQIMTNALEGMKVVDMIERIYEASGFKK